MIIGQQYILSCKTHPSWSGMVVVCTHGGSGDWFGKVIKSPVPEWNEGHGIRMSYRTFEWRLDKESKFKRLMEMYESNKETIKKTTLYERNKAK